MDETPPFRTPPSKTLPHCTAGDAVGGKRVTTSPPVAPCPCRCRSVWLSAWGFESLRARHTATARWGGKVTNRTVLWHLCQPLRRHEKCHRLRRTRCRRMARPLRTSRFRLAWSFRQLIRAGFRFIQIGAVPRYHPVVLLSAKGSKGEGHPTARRSRCGARQGAEQRI